MNIDRLAIAIASSILMDQTFAAALDRSGQSVTAFLQPRNYAEISYSALRPEVRGIDNAGNSISNIAKFYAFPTGAIKFQPTNQISVGLLFDEPYGTKATYEGNNNFTTDGSLGISGGTHANVESKSLTGLIGYEPWENFKIYGGIAYEQIQGSADLRGTAYSVFNGYSNNFEKDGDLGWVAGFAYEMPEMALKTALTYRSKIKHSLKTHEEIQINTLLNNVDVGLNQVNNGLTQVNAALTQMSTLPNDSPQKAALIKQQQSLNNMRTNLSSQQAQLNALNSFTPAILDSETQITSPQSVNFDFQMGVMQNTVMFGTVRWVNWSKFAINPTIFDSVATAIYPDSNGFPFLDYTKDQWSGNLGLGRKFNDKLSGSFSVGWDSGTGKPIGSLGPTDGHKNIGISLRYNATDKIEFSGGLKYYWLGSATGTVAKRTSVSEFDDNSALGLGIKLGYRF